MIPIYEHYRTVLFNFCGGVRSPITINFLFLLSIMVIFSLCLHFCAADCGKKMS